MADARIRTLTGGMMTGRELILKAAKDCGISEQNAEQLAITIAQFGYVCVPKVPTEEMLDEGWASAHEEDATGVWKYMIEASEKTR